MSAIKLLLRSGETVLHRKIGEELLLPTLMLDVSCVKAPLEVLESHFAGDFFSLSLTVAVAG